MQNWITEEEIEDFIGNIKVEPETCCHIWQGSMSPNGYGVTHVGKKPISVHRLAYLLFEGEIEEGMCICHHCDTRLCANADHLFQGTKKQNSEDAVAKGRYKTGFRPSKRTVTQNELDEMVSRYASGQSWYRIGKDLNRPQQHVKVRVESVLYADIDEFLAGFEASVTEVEAAQ